MLLAVHYRVMKLLGSLESTQEARVALDYRFRQLLRFFRAQHVLNTVHVFYFLRPVYNNNNNNNNFIYPYT